MRDEDLLPSNPWLFPEWHLRLSPVRETDAARRRPVFKIRPRGDPSRIAVSGDSTGGNLAAVMALKSRDLNGPRIAIQILYYPTVNMVDLRTKSMEDFAEGYFLTRAQIQFNYNQYVPAANRSHPYASPLLAPDHRGLPPALIITAAFDPLRDSGEAYARKLADAGVTTHLSRYEGVVHGFLSFPFVRKADRAIDESAAALREAFGRNSF